MSIAQEPIVDVLDSSLLLGALTALKRGDFSVRLPHDWIGRAGKVADAINEVCDLNERMAKELKRLNHVVGKEGRITQRANMGAVAGSWAEAIGSVNELIDDLVHPTSETARVIGAVAQGDLSQTMALEVDDRPLQGEYLRTAKLVNKMVDQLGSFASEVTRVAREVGVDGKLGGQAKVPGAAGTWKGLTENVNQLAANLTNQVRAIAEVATAPAAKPHRRQAAAPTVARRRPRRQASRSGVGPAIPTSAYRPSCAEASLNSLLRSIDPWIDRREGSASA